VKCKSLIVGDGAIGKTCLLTRISGATIDWADETYEPTAFDHQEETWELEGSTIKLDMWDSAGQEGYASLRQLSYAKTDIWLISYACNNQTSLNNIEASWLEEIVSWRKENDVDEVPWTILVGTKKDIRTISEDAAKAVAKSMDACAMVDTSAKEEDCDANGVNELKKMISTLAVMKAAGKPRPSPFNSKPSGGAPKDGPGDEKKSGGGSQDSNNDKGCECSIQ